MAKVFFSNQDIILLTVAVYLGAVATDLFKAFTKDILAPLASVFVKRHEVDGFEIELFGVKLEVGDFLFQLGNALVAIVIVLFASKLLRKYGGAWLKHFYM
jgi:large-conductance mechanosensitive channel